MTIDTLVTPKSRPWLWLLLIYTAMLLIDGCSEQDAWQFVTIAIDPTMILERGRYEFLYSSPLNYFIVYAFGKSTLFAFFFVHICEIIAMLGTILWCVNKKFPEKEKQVTFLALSALFPLLYVTLKWVGKPDPILISMMFLCWAYPGRWRWCAAALMVMAHREMGVFMCLFLFASEKKPDYSLAVPILIGIGAHYYYQTHVLDYTPLSRVEDLGKNVWLHPLEFLKRPVVYVIDSLSWYWLVVLWRRPNCRQCLGFLAAFGIAVASLDFTRDFALMALAPLLFHLEEVVQTPSSVSLVRFLPLCLLQVQLAFNDSAFKSNNVLLDIIVDGIRSHLTK